MLGGKSQPPAGGQVERRTLPVAFDDKCRKTGAARRIGCGPEQRPGIGRDAQDQRVRIAAQLNETRPMEPPPKPFRLVGPEPEDRRTPADRSQRQHGCETRDGSRIVASFGEQLMHPSAPETAAQRLIEHGISGCDPPIAGQQFPTGNCSQVPLEHDKVINRLAHYLFPLCSQVGFGLARVKQRPVPP